MTYSRCQTFQSVLEKWYSMAKFLLKMNYVGSSFLSFFFGPSEGSSFSFQNLLYATAGHNSLAGWLQKVKSKK